MRATKFRSALSTAQLCLASMLVNQLLSDLNWALNTWNDPGITSSTPCCNFFLASTTKKEKEGICTFDCGTPHRGLT